MGSEKVVFLVIFIHPFENSGGYFFWGRLFWWILDINLQNLVRGYFSKFLLRALTKPAKPNLPILLVKAVNAWVRSAFGNVSLYKHSPCHLDH